MKYPIGIQSFDQLINDGYVYVDKTDLVYSLVTEGKIYFLVRPRRFGKSLLISTLEHYFLGHKELFKGLKIDSLEKDWLEYPVFHIDFNGIDFARFGKLEEIIDFNLTAWEKKYGIVPDKQLDAGLRFVQVLQKAHELTGRHCVVLVDEYDKPMLDVLDTGVKVESNGQEYLLEDWREGGIERTGIFVGRLEPEDFAGILFGIQGGGCGLAVCAADGGDEVPPGERVQRLQPTERHQHGSSL